MSTRKLIYPFIAGFFVCLIILASCKSKQERSSHFASTPQELNEKAKELISSTFQQSSLPSFLSGDSSFVFSQKEFVAFLYSGKEYTTNWCSKENWLASGDSLYHFIENAQLYGLFPEDYHADGLRLIRNKFTADSLGKSDRKDAALWAKADIMLTDAFVQIVKDIKIGRLPDDSISLRKDSVLSNEFYQQQLTAVSSNGLISTIKSLEPKQPEYALLKSGIKKFLDSSDYRKFTVIPYPEKNRQKFQLALQKRLYEGRFISFDSTAADSTQIADAVKLFQKKKGIAVDGVAGEGTVRMLNVSDREKFIRIAISMDKYKLLPEKMPAKYIWVNTSSNYLQVINGDKVDLSSKVISGKAKTRTPLLNCAVSVIITYPQWVPPPSIVGKEILPAVKKNPGYLARKGFSLVDSKGNEVDPYSVDWSKYSKGIPYRVVQGSGDANSLGIMKFHFDNKYSVYLHDTNQRYLFANAMRSLSHGCVRVQEWQQLAFYLFRNDSILNAGNNYTKIDSVKAWLARKQKRNISIKNKMPLFIRNVTCEGRNGNILFYDDIYGEDKMIREKYFATK